MKACTKCAQMKPSAEFNKHRGRLDGLQPYCKACSRAHSIQYHVNNRDKCKALQAKYRADHREAYRARAKKWRVDHNQEKRIYDAKYYADHPDECKSRMATWKSTNPEAQRVININRRARKAKTPGRLSSDIAERLFKLQRGKCVCGCRQPLGNNYHRDHIMPLALGGTNTDDNIQLLRQQCNNQKHAKHPIEFMQQRGFLL